MGRFDEAEAAYRRAIALDPKSASPWDSLGNLLQDQLGRFEEAEAAYRKSMALDPEDGCAVSNLAYALLPDPGRREDAEMLCERALASLPVHGARLLRAFRRLARDDWDGTVEHLAPVLDEGHPDLFSVFWDDLLRLLRLAKARGHGARLLQWLDDTGYGERYQPLRAAFVAYLTDAAKLRDVNPEVGGAARRIYDWLASDGSAGRAE